jgi:phage gp46-like protein
MIDIDIRSLIENGELTTKRGLDGACLVSVFTDGAERAWWGESFCRAKGSTMFRHRRAKNSTETKDAIGAACRTALQWLTEDNIVERISVDVQRKNLAIIGVNITLDNTTVEAKL